MCYSTYGSRHLIKPAWEFGARAKPTSEHSYCTPFEAIDQASLRCVIALLDQSYNESCSTVRVCGVCRETARGTSKDGWFC